MRFALLGVTLAATTVAACRPTSATFTPQDEAAIRAMNDSVAVYVRTGRWDKWAALYADDAVLQPANAKPIVGRPAIEQFGHAFPPVDSVSMFDAHIAGSGDLAYLTNRFSIKLRGAPMDTSKQLVVFRRTDGTWKAIAVSFSSDRPPTAAPTTAPAPSTAAKR